MTKPGLLPNSFTAAPEPSAIAVALPILRDLTLTRDLTLAREHEEKNQRPGAFMMAHRGFYSASQV
jgi:hypothetical protein